MIAKNLVFAFRNIGRNKLLAAINVLGLSIGISACLVIFLIVRYEMSFDRFQPAKDRIYRMYSAFSGVFTAKNHGISTGIPVEVRDHFTGVESLTNFHNFSARVDVPDRNGKLTSFGGYNKIIIADAGYFEVFSYYQWVAGNPNESLTQPFQVVLSENRAKIYFGDVDLSTVIGKEIHYRDSLVVTVSGIVKDIKERTDLDFTDFISFTTIEKCWLKDDIRLNDWGNTNSSSQFFIKLSEGITADKVQSQIPRLTEMYDKHNPESGGWVLTPTLQPLTDVHFNAEVGIFDGSRAVVEKSTLRTLVGIAVLLLIMATINFVNLETAQASTRGKEVGIRKALGSSRTKLILQFLTESFILCVLAGLFSIVITSMSLEFFSAYIAQGVVFDITEPSVFLFLICCILVVTLLAGLYPAFVLSSYQPALALKNLLGSNSGTSRSAFVRKFLTVFQFSFSYILIVGTVGVGLQLNYMLNKDLGFDPEAIIFVSTPWWENASKRLQFKNELEQIPEIESISIHQNPPSFGGVTTSTMEFNNGKEVLTHNVYLKRGDTSYIRIYDIELLAGRNLLPRDSAKEYLINESYMRALGFKDAREPLGKTVNKEFTIVGVIRDFHIQSLHSPIRPTAILYDANSGSIGIKLATPENRVSDLKKGIDKIAAAWKEIYPDEKIQYSFVDETIERFYEAEVRTGKLAGIATGIAILISCLGLFGLSSFTVFQRTKEIGIRKVLGATVNNILLLLSKDFVKLVSIACLIAAPVAYYITESWLQRYAFRMDVNAWLFLASGFTSIIIAFITISFRTVGAAQSDPVKSLRYE